MKALALAGLLICASVPGTSSYNPATWMSEMWNSIEGTSLADIWLPGSHDSGTFDLDGATSHSESCDENFHTHADGLPSDVDVAKLMAVAQLRSLKEQAAIGARYFDLRLWSEGNNDIRFVHCKLSYKSIETYLKDLASWIRSNTNREVFVLDFYKFLPTSSQASSSHGVFSTSQYQYVLSLVVKIFGPDLLTTGVTPKSTMSQIIGAGGSKVLLMIRNDMTQLQLSTLKDSQYWLLDSSYLSRDWKDVFSTNQLLDRNKEFYRRDNAIIQGNSILYVMDSVTTPPADVTKYVSLAWEAFYANTAVTSMLIRWQGDLNYRVVQSMFQNWVQRGNFQNGKWQPGKSGMVMMIDNINEHYAMLIASANVNDAVTPTEFNYGRCSSKWDAKVLYWQSECAYSNAKGCASGFVDRNYKKWGSCRCQCSMAGDFGCGTQQQYACE